MTSYQVRRGRTATENGAYHAISGMTVTANQGSSSRVITYNQLLELRTAATAKKRG